MVAFLLNKKCVIMLLPIFAKRSIVDIWQGSEYASEF